MLFFTIVYHFLKCRSIVVCACHRPIDVCIQYHRVVLFCIFVAHSQLSFDWLFRLAVARISRVYNCRFHFVLPPLICLSTGNENIGKSAVGQGNKKKNVHNLFVEWFLHCFSPLPQGVSDTLSRRKKIVFCVWWNDVINNFHFIKPHICKRFASQVKRKKYSTNTKCDVYVTRMFFLSFCRWQWFMHIV